MATNGTSNKALAFKIRRPYKGMDREYNHQAFLLNQFHTYTALLEYKDTGFVKWSLFSPPFDTSNPYHNIGNTFNHLNVPLLDHSIRVSASENP